MTDATPLEALTAPGDPRARMDAYYFGFERTGIGIVDDLLTAIATAGKGYHHTEYWSDPVFDGGLSYADRIQAAADRAAAAIRKAATPEETP